MFLQSRCVFNIIVCINYFAVPVRNFNDENSLWELGDLPVEADTGISVPHLVDTHREEPGVPQQTPDAQTISTGSNRNQETHQFQTASANNENLEKSEPVQESSPPYSRFNKLQKFVNMFKFVNRICQFYSCPI